MLSPLGARAHQDGERGAVAILVVLLVVLVGLPVSALGLTTYVKSSAQAELQQAANTAALAGASSIPLGDLAYALEYTGADGVLAGADRAVGTADRRVDAVLARLEAQLERVERETDRDLPPLQASLPEAPLSGRTVLVEPLRNACAQAALAVGTMPFNGVWAFPRLDAVANPEGRECDAAPDAATGTPGSVDGFAGAKYYRDASIVGALGDCVSAARSTLQVVPSAVRDRVPGPVQRRLAQAEQTVDGLASVLPALLRPGVIVQVRQSVEGPLETLLGSTGATEQIATARARRRVKNLVVVPYDSRLRLDLVGAANDATSAVKETLVGTSALLEELDAALDGVVVPVPPLSSVPVPDTGTPLDGVLDGTTDQVDGALPDSVALPGLPLGECADVIDAAVNDYDDALAPAETSSATDILRDAAAGREPVVVAVTGPNSTFFDTVPVCLTQPVQGGVAEPLPDADGNGVPDQIVVGAEVELQVDEDELVRGVACAPGTPGAFRASLVR